MSSLRASNPPQALCPLPAERVYHKSHILHTHLPIRYYLSFFKFIVTRFYFSVFFVNDFKLNDDEPMISKTVSLQRASLADANSKQVD